MGIGNYFGVNYANHYHCGQSQSYHSHQSHCGTPHPPSYHHGPGYGYGQPPYNHCCGQGGGYGYNPFSMFLNMMRRFFGSQGGYPTPTPTPKPAYFEGPGVGKIVAGPGEGPGVGKLVAGPGEGTAGWNTMAVHQAMANAFME